LLGSRACPFALGTLAREAAALFELRLRTFEAENRRSA
jgi:hypothetical protein